MSSRATQMCEQLQSLFPENESIHVDIDLVSMSVQPADLLAVCTELRDNPACAFAQLTDLCGVDYATYGQSEWSTETDSDASFSRAVNASSVGTLTFNTGLDLPELSHARFAAVTHLLSLDHNVRLRVNCMAPDDDIPTVPSLTSVWSGAEWFEREAFDLFGILFDGHNDLRRLLTDYGFTGHPFRKDFPLIGNVEMRYDPLKKRVVYEPVSIEPRVLVPRVIREDSRYESGEEVPAEEDANNA